MTFVYLGTVSLSAEKGAFKLNEWLLIICLIVFYNVRLLRNLFLFFYFFSNSPWCGKTLTSKTNGDVVSHAVAVWALCAAYSEQCPWTALSKGHFNKPSSTTCLSGLSKRVGQQAQEGRALATLGYDLHQPLTG